MFRVSWLENELEHLQEKMNPHEAELCMELDRYRRTVKPSPDKSDLETRATVQKRLFLIQSNPERKTLENAMAIVREETFSWCDWQSESWWKTGIKDWLFVVLLSVFAFSWAAYIYFRTFHRLPI